MAIEGYDQHLANNGCPYTRDGHFCQDVRDHEKAPPLGRGNLHWVKLFSPLTGSSTLEWP